MNIYVGNLSYNATEADLRAAFEQHGAVSTASVIMDKMTGRSRGFGFVEMANDDAGRAAIEGTNGKNFHGRDLVVNEARPRTEGDRPSFGGGGRSGGGDGREASTGAAGVAEPVSGGPGVPGTVRRVHRRQAPQPQRRQ